MVWVTDRDWHNSKLHLFVYLLACDLNIWSQPQAATQAKTNWTKKWVWFHSIYLNRDKIILFIYCCTCVLKLISDVFVMRSSLKSQCISLDKSKTRYDCRSREQPTTAHKLVIWHTWCPKITKWAFFDLLAFSASLFFFVLKTQEHSLCSNFCVICLSIFGYLVWHISYHYLCCEFGLSEMSHSAIKWHNFWTWN